MSLCQNQKTFLILLLGLLLGLGSAFAATSSSTNNSANSAMPLMDTSTMLLLVIVILLLFAFASLPILWNIKGYYDHLKDVRNLLNDKLSSGAGQTELIQLVKDALAVQSSGMQGVARATMALTLSVILGVAVILLIADPRKSDDTTLQLVKDVLLALTGAISSIIGFYFGGRATQSAEAQTSGGGSAGSAAAERPAVVKFTTDPESSAKKGEKVRLSCSATNPSGGSLQYRFEVMDREGRRVDGTPGYQNQNEWEWIPQEEGRYHLWVYVRDGLHADIGGYDARAGKEFEIKNE